MGDNAHRRPALRPTAVAAAFLRMDIIEDVSYPLWLILHHVGLIAPIFIYYFIGELVGEAPAVGGDYFTFATVGLCVSTILQASLTGFNWALSRAQDRGTFETMLVAPVPWAALPFAMNLWRSITGIFSGAIVFGIGLVLGATYDPSGIPAFLVIILLGVIASVAVSILAATLMVLSKRAQPLLTLYGLAASVLAGALFSVDQLPRVLQWASMLIPHTYVINAARDVLMQDPGTFSIPFSRAVVALLAFNAVALTVGTWLIARSLQYGRRMGLLSGY